MKTGKKMRAGAIKSRAEKIEKEEAKLLFLIAEVQAKSDELTAGGTIGAAGEKYVTILDELRKADELIAEGVKRIKKAARINGENEA